MTGLPENIEEILTELVEKSRQEMNVMLALADAVRRTDEQLLREVRNVTLHHEMRREEIKGELQALASRLCALPGSGRKNIEHDDKSYTTPPPIPSFMNNGEAKTNGVEHHDWSATAADIDMDLSDTFGGDLPRH